MKKCEYFKSLILTDFIDGELDKVLFESVQGHLLDCSDCRTFLKEVKKNSVLHSQQAANQPVPAELWDAIKENIEYENQATHPFADFIDRLKGLITFPRLVPVLASLLLMLLVGSVTLNTIQIQRAQEKDQGEYLVSLLSSAGSSLQGAANEGGTPIEHYFL